MGSIKFYEGNNVINPEKIDDIFSGKLVGCIFRNVFCNEVCKRIYKNMWEKRVLTKQTTIEPNYFMAGVGHYEKSLHDYLKQSDKFCESLHEIFDGAINCYEIIFSQLFNHYLKHEIAFRRAMHDNKQACPFVIRVFQNHLPYVICPHEDISQCCDSKQKGFEIQAVENSGNIIGFNFCFANEFGGDLIIWNLTAEQNTNSRFKSTGYGYSETLLKNAEKIRISLSPGDIYFLNAAYIHAVISTKTNQGYRATLSNFMAKINDHTIVTWT